MTIKIPQNNRFRMTDSTDLFGNIYYTKSVNLNENGYLKLSPRTVSLLSSEDDADFNFPVSFGRYTGGSFYVATVENPYILTIESAMTGNSIAKDTDNGDDAPPALDFETGGKWFNGLWHVTTTLQLHSKNPSNGNWTDRNALSSGFSHPLENFYRGNTLMIGDGASVIQLSTGYSTTNLSQLTLNPNFEVVALAYNNNLLAIGTRLKSGIEGEDLSARLFIWDGSEASPNGSYSVDAESIVDVVPYKSSFAILTQNAEILYFNGGGFERLAAFPIYFKEYVWGDFLNKVQYGDCLRVDGDLIYININSAVSDVVAQTSDETFIAGVWCFDPEIGLYHRYAPSISKAQVITTNSGVMNTSTGIMTVSTGAFSFSSYSLPTTGNPVKIISSSSDNFPVGEMFYIIKLNSTTYKLATSYENAIAGEYVEITDAGDIAFMTIDLKDFGQSATETSGGGVSLFGSKTYAYENILFGGRYKDSNSASNHSHLNIGVSGFKNIGYFVTSKILSSGVEENLQNITIKYRPLKSEDSITIKYKNKDFLDLPQTALCTATSGTVLTTTTNINASYTHTGELECEVIKGSGAGNIVKVTSITENAGTYTITLAETLEGVSASDTMTIKIDNWVTLDTITDADSNNWKTIPIAKNSKWTKFKVILTGSDVAIEDLLIQNVSQISGK